MGVQSCNEEGFVGGKKIIALCCSTGGPKALQDVIPKLPKDLSVPMLVVQHMPEGFTKTLANRLNQVSEVEVEEAAEGTVIEKGHVYIARAGNHMQVIYKNNKHYLTLTDEPPREGVKPCANYMYESLANSNYSHIICVVMTGMGADGTEGIMRLREKKSTSVIIQDKNSCVVFGMPGSILKKQIPCKEVALTDITKEIVKKMG